MLQSKPLPAPGKSLLSGLGSNRDVSAYTKGQQMQGDAALGMQRAQSQQESSVSSAQSEIQRRMRAAQNSANRFGNEAQERIAGSQLDNRRSVFDIGMGFDYAALNRRRQLNLQQSLLNGIARDF